MEEQLFFPSCSQDRFVIYIYFKFNHTFKLFTITSTLCLHMTPNSLTFLSSLHLSLHPTHWAALCNHLHVKQNLNYKRSRRRNTTLISILFVCDTPLLIKLSFWLWLRLHLWQATDCAVHFVGRMEWEIKILEVVLAKKINENLFSVCSPTYRQSN